MGEGYQAIRSASGLSQSGNSAGQFLLLASFTGHHLSKLGEFRSNTPRKLDKLYAWSKPRVEALLDSP